jgi:hypothetical protein
VSVILSGTAPEQSMSYPDYDQTPHDHSALLVVVRHIGKLLLHQTIRVGPKVTRDNSVSYLLI